MPKMGKKSAIMNRQPNNGRLLWDELTETNETETKDRRRLVTLHPPKDTLKTLRAMKTRVTVVMLDPWYNKGIGGIRDDYHEWLSSVVEESARIADHVYVWGFPEIIWKLLNNLPGKLSLVAWLTWYYK